jgi:uncharacterized delta-60 repeat protein
MNSDRRISLILVLAATLCACGGGGSGSGVEDTPPSSPPPPTTAAGTLEFSAASYNVVESDGLSGFVLVTRTGGSTGIVTAKIRLEAGTASVTADFDDRDLDVMFGDGDTAPRLIPLPIVSDDADEDDETLALELHSPEGCAMLGAQTAADITITDDDVPGEEPGTYTIGGTLTALAGSGLVLTNLSTDDLPLSADGPFMFDREYPSGFVYNVRVHLQPTNPRQSCTLINGSGTISDADVTNIEVTCETLPDGSALDAQFGTDGRVTSDLLGGAAKIAVQSDGKILVVGADKLVRYTAAGALDTTFGTNGEVSVDVYGASYDRLAGVTVQPDGRIVVAGYSRNGNNSPTQEEFITARFNGDGSTDTSFGTNGKVVTDFDGRGDGAYNVIIQPDGAIVVTGSAAIIDAFGVSDSDFAVVRYTSAGALDNTFGTGGMATANVAGRSDLGYGAALQVDGKIIVAGRVANSGGANPDIGIVRFNADGTLDSTFGTGGVLRDATSDWDEADEVVVQPDGKIVVVGLTNTTVASLTLARYNGDGSVDTQFGSNGRTTSSIMEVGRGIALQPNGAIIAGGWRADDFALARFDANGTLDTTFGTDGGLQIDFFGAADSANTVAVQADGKILIGGTARNGTVVGLGLARVAP